MTPIAASKLCWTKECLYASLLIREAMDEAVDPCEDFYQYACGRWGKQNPVDPNEIDLSTLDVLRKERLRETKG